MSSRRYQSPALHPANLLTSANNIADAQIELMRKLGKVEFLPWTLLANHDIAAQSIRLDAWDEMVRSELGRHTKFSSRRMAIANSINTATYYSNCAIITSDAFMNPVFENKSALWAGMGIEKFLQAEHALILNRKHDIIELRHCYGANQHMCSNRNVTFDFFMVREKNSLGFESDVPEHWVKNVLFPYLTIPWRDSELLHKNGLADEFARAAAALIAHTSHDFPVHTATDQEENKMIIGNTCELVSLINKAEPENGKYYTYEDLCMALNAAIFYVAREHGFNNPLLNATDNMSSIADKLWKTGRREEKDLAEGLKEISFYFISNYIERKALASNGDRLTFLLAVGRAGDQSSQWPVMADYDGNDWYTLPEISDKLYEAVDDDARFALDERHLSFIDRVAATRNTGHKVKA